MDEVHHHIVEAYDEGSDWENCRDDEAVFVEGLHAAIIAVGEAPLGRNVGVQWDSIIWINTHIF